MPRSPFSLMEVMTAMLILGISLTAILSGFGQSLRNSSTARDLATAGFLAQDLLAEARLQSDLPEGRSKGDWGADYPGFRWERNVVRGKLRRHLLVEVAVIVQRGGTERTVTASECLFLSFQNQQPKSQETR